MRRSRDCKAVVISLFAVMIGATSSAAIDYPKPKTPVPDRNHPISPPILDDRPASGLRKIVVGGITLDYGLQCITKTMPAQSGSNAAEQAIVLDPVQIRQGYSVTGGSCDFMWRPTIPGLVRGIATEDHPIVDDKHSHDRLKGWECKIGNGIKPNESHPVEYRVSAHLTACKMSIQESAFGAPAAWTTPGDGTLVMLMRPASGDFDKPAPFSVQVCMTGENSQFQGADRVVQVYVWVTGKDVDLANNQMTYSLPLGKCLQIDQPSAIIVQQGQDEGGVVSGSYELLKAGTFTNNKDAVITNPIQPTPSDETEVIIGNPIEITAPCSALPTPTKFYYTYCKLDLPNAGGASDRKAYRICIGTDYITKNGLSPYPAYAASLMDIMFDKALLNVTQSSNYDYKWNPIFPGVCHDVFFATEAYFMIGPDITGGYWDSTKVQQVNATVQEISWK